MRNLVQIREAITALSAEAEALTVLARDEKRDLAADEAVRLDAILGTADKSGEIDALRKEEARAVRLEALQADAIARANPQPAPVVPQNGSPRIRVESSVMRPAVLNLGRGVMSRIEQEEHAYGFGRFLMASLFSHDSSRQWCQDHGVTIRNAMSEGFDSKGGVLVPGEYEATLIRLVNEYGVAAGELQNVPMAGDTKDVPRRTGGLTSYFVAEAGTLTASDAAYDKIGLTAKKLAVLARHSIELGEDAVISIGDQLGTEAALAIATKVDECAFNGDATSTYGHITGWKNALLAGSEYTAATGNTGFATLDLEDFEGMLAKVQSYAFKFGNAKWYIHRAGWATSMLRLSQAAGGNTVSNVVSGTPMNSFLGYPIVFVEVMNNTLGAQVSTEGLCYFGDLRQCGMFGQRRGIAVAMSNDVYFTSDETAIKWTTRFDINCHDVGTASASGGVVQLLTPSS